MKMETCHMAEHYRDRVCVATYCRWGGNLCSVYVENFLANQLMKNFENRSTFATVIIKHQVASFFETQYMFIFRRTLLPVRYVSLMARSVRLSVVCDVLPLYSRSWTFRNNFVPFVAQELGQFVLIFWGKMQRGSRWLCKLNGRGYEKLAFFDECPALLSCRSW